VFKTIFESNSFYSSLHSLPKTHFRHAEVDNFDHDTFQPCWNRHFRPQHIPAMLKLVILTKHVIVMLKLTLLTTPYSSHAETDVYHHITFSPYWNWPCRPQLIHAMLKLSILTTTHSSHDETCDFDHDTFQACWTWRCQPQHIPACWKWRCRPQQIPVMLKLAILIMIHTHHAETDIVNTFQSC
jgi:hypothetical protein